MVDLSSDDAFEEAFNTYYRQLAAFSFQYVDDHDLAEEIVQEVFSTVWQKAKEIEIRTSVKSYLYGAVRNACLNYLKHKKIERRYEEQEKSKSSIYDVDVVELDELQAEIDSALNQLPEKCRQIFEMSRFEEKKYKEIATELNISIKTVENQIGRALKVMHSSLGKYLPGFIPWVISLIQKCLWG